MPNSTEAPKRSITETQRVVPQLVVFSGGTAFNHYAEQLSARLPCTSHILPVSDDGGSTAEIIRVLGGPAIGDIRSRCLRISDSSTPEAAAVKRLLGHRLSNNPTEARAEWDQVVEGRSSYWSGITRPFADTIRAFLVHFNNEVLQRAASTDPAFDFSNGSIGNYFFAGARTVLCSLDAAIFLYARVSRIPLESKPVDFYTFVRHFRASTMESYMVLPVTNVTIRERVVLGCELQDGSRLLGQSRISHPSRMRTSSVESTSVNKGDFEPLPSPVSRCFYLASELLPSGEVHEVRREAHPAALEALREADAVVFGVGSLWTSICPSLIVRGVADVIAALPDGTPKILMLNGSYDRETTGMGAADVVLAITSSLNQGRTDGRELPARAYVNTVMVPRGGAIAVDADAIRALGVEVVVELEAERSNESGTVSFCVEPLVGALSRYAHASLSRRLEREQQQQQ